MIWQSAETEGSARLEEESVVVKTLRECINKLIKLYRLHYPRKEYTYITEQIRVMQVDTVIERCLDTKYEPDYVYIFEATL